MSESLHHETVRIPKFNHDTVTGAGRITILEALATETHMVSPDALGRSTPDGFGNDMDD